MFVAMARLALFPASKQDSAIAAGRDPQGQVYVMFRDYPGSHKERGGGDPDSPLYRDYNSGEGSPGAAVYCSSMKIFSLF